MVDLAPGNKNQRLLIDVYSTAPVDLELDSHQWKAVRTGLSGGRAQRWRLRDAPSESRLPEARRNSRGAHGRHDAGWAPPNYRHSRPDLRLGRRATVTNDGLVLVCALSGVLYQFWLAFGAEQKVRPRFGATSKSALAAWSACAVVLAAAFVVAKPLFGITVELSYGDDWLAYESNARNVGEGGLLMPLGRAPGSGANFLYPLYSYTLAGVHWLVGDGDAAAVLFNKYGLRRLLPLLLGPSVAHAATRGAGYRPGGPDGHVYPRIDLLGRNTHR